MAVRSPTALMLPLVLSSATRVARPVVVSIVISHLPAGAVVPATRSVTVATAYSTSPASKSIALMLS